MTGDVALHHVDERAQRGSTWRRLGSIDDYAERRTKQIERWKRYDGQQSGDPAKLSRALLRIADEKVDQKQPPLRFIAGADAIATAEQVASTLQQQTNAFRELSTSLAFDDIGSS